MKNVRIRAICAVPVAFAILAAPALAQRTNGTTLAAYKTVDVCAVSDTIWRYSGEIAVWNEGAVATIGLKVNDWIQTKPGVQWVDVYQALTDVGGTIAAGTTSTTATIFPYSVDGAPLTTGVRNRATVQILNHSGSIGTYKGPEPKATLMETVAPCPTTGGCSYTQGYWGAKPDVVWPAPYSRDAAFYLSGLTWQQIFGAQVSDSPGYYQLGQQFIAAVLNKANGAYVPSGVQTTLTLADAWLGANTQAACTAKGSCGTQKDWAAVLASFNEGSYPGGPSHCGD